MKQRIQKVLASAGFGSRRACEDLVRDGRISVNGRVVRDLPIVVDPERDRIAVDGKHVRSSRHVYFMLNKPKGVYCTNHDPAGRMRAVDLMTGVRERLFPVGRLDADSTGLLLMTNDGDLAQRLTHPRFGAPRTYRAEVAGCPTPDDLEKIRRGIWLSEGKTAPAVVKIVYRQRTKAILEITLREGKNREIRRMLARLGHNVRRLMRIRIGKLSLGSLALGAYRPLKPAEVAGLRTLADSDKPPRPPRDMPPRRRRGSISSRSIKRTPRRSKARATKK